MEPPIKMNGKHEVPHDKDFPYFLVFLTCLFSLFHTISFILFILLNFNKIFFVLLILFSSLSFLAFNFTIDRCNCKPFFAACTRFVKFYFGIAIIIANNLMKTTRTSIKILVLAIICTLLDVTRSYFVELVKYNYRKRLCTGTFSNVLKFERFLQYELGNITKNKLKERINDDVRTFEARGEPIQIKPEILFRKWSRIGTTSENKESISILDNHIKCNLSPDGNCQEFLKNENSIFKKSLANLKIDNTKDISLKGFYFPVVKELPKKFQSEFGRYSTFEVSEDLNTLKKSHEKFPSFAKITLKNLIHEFGEVDGQEIYEIISYDKFEDVPWDHFKWNIRQIYIERAGLYRAIQDSTKLVHKITALSYVIFGIISLTLLNFVIQFDLPVLKIPAPIFAFAFLMVVKDSVGSFISIIFSDSFIAGDRVIINSETYTVVKINIFSSKFWKWSGETVYISNKWLAEHPIRNIRKTGSQKWETTLIISANTTEKEIEDLRKYLSNIAIENQQYFDKITCNIQSIQNSDKLKLLIYVGHKRNFQIGLYRWNRHQIFMKKLIEYLKTSGIEYVPIEVPLKVNNIAVAEQKFQDMASVFNN